LDTTPKTLPVQNYFYGNFANYAEVTKKFRECCMATVSSCREM